LESKWIPSVLPTIIVHDLQPVHHGESPLQFITMLMATQQEAEEDQGRYRLPCSQRYQIVQS
jgi:hypothetical protein